MLKYLLAGAASLAAILLFATHARADDICTDRPGKSYGTCTVDKGHFQVEADIYSGTYATGPAANTFLNPTVKYGVTDKIDLEAGMALVQNNGHTFGVGDLYLRAKIQAFNSGAFSASIMPYVKAPTASAHFGNGAWEGGVITPLAYKLSPTWQIGLSPEVDVLRDASGIGAHVSTQQVVNLSHNLTSKISVASELWAQYDFDPKGLNRQYSNDYSVAYLVNSNFQLDAGVNIGLNKTTPNQVYFGVSKRF